MNSSLTNNRIISISINSKYLMFFKGTSFRTRNWELGTNIFLELCFSSSWLAINFTNFSRSFKGHGSSSSSKSDWLNIILERWIVFFFSVSNDYNDFSVFRIYHSRVNSSFTYRWFVIIYLCTNNASEAFFTWFRTSNSDRFSSWSV